ncbi:MAG: alginate export family protein [Planctomycetota bacterium]
MPSSTSESPLSRPKSAALSASTAALALALAAPITAEPSPLDRFFAVTPAAEPAPPVTPPLGTPGSAVPPATLEAAAPADPAAADLTPPNPTLEDIVKAGKVTFDLRLRYQYADRRGLEPSNAATGRLRLGYKTDTYEGLSGFIEFEGTRAADPQGFNSVVNGVPGTVIADPENEELNQLFLQYAYENPDSGYKFIGRAGRQRIILDDARFIGNVGWRQNEQTFDAGYVDISPFKNFSARYGYISEVNRIFGEDGSGGTADFESDSHIINVALNQLKIGDVNLGKLVGFAYLFDFSNSEANSVNTFGARLTGKQPINDDWAIAYAGSYAVQTDVDGNPNGDFEVDYAALELKGIYQGKYQFGAGYEILGSDDGIQFRTPLATLHKFNGLADVFLAGPQSNGGPFGLQDFYAFVAAPLPYGFKAKVVYHNFANAEEGDFLGQEIDFVVTKKLSANATFLVKYANFYDGDSYTVPGGPTITFDDITRTTFQIDFKF